MRITDSIYLIVHHFYTTNPTECSAAATEPLTSESDLESSVESHLALVEQWPSKSVERSVKKMHTGGVQDAETYF